MPTSLVVKEKILLQLEELIPQTTETEELMLASKAVLDLDEVQPEDDVPPNWDEILTRLAALELSVGELEGEVSNQGDAIDAHRIDYNNPHNVAAVQSGSYAKEQSDELFAARVHNHDSVYAAIDHTHPDLVPNERTVNGRSLIRDIDLTKADIGLGLVNDWGATSDINNPSTELYATAAAVKALNDILGGGSTAGLAEAWGAIDELKAKLGNEQPTPTPTAVDVSADHYTKAESDAKYRNVDNTEFNGLTIVGEDGNTVKITSSENGLSITIGETEVMSLDGSGNIVIPSTITLGDEVPLTLGSEPIVTMLDTIGKLNNKQTRTYRQLQEALDRIAILEATVL